MKKNHLITSVTANEQQIGFISKLKVELWKVAVTHGMHLFQPDLHLVVSAQCVPKLVQTNLL